MIVTHVEAQSASHSALRRGPRATASDSRFDDALREATAWVADLGERLGRIRETTADGGTVLAAPELARGTRLADPFAARWRRAAVALGVVPGDGRATAPAKGAGIASSNEPVPVAGATWIAELHREVTAAAALDPAVVAWLLEEQPAFAAGGTIHDARVDVRPAVESYAARFPVARIAGTELQPGLFASETERTRNLQRTTIRSVSLDALDDWRTFDASVVALSPDVGGAMSQRNVLERVRRGLVPGGLVVVTALPAPAEATAGHARALDRAVSALQLIEPAMGSGMLTEQELRQRLIETGFQAITMPFQEHARPLTMLARRRPLTR